METDGHGNGKTITITRERIRRGRRVVWSYVYRVSGDPMLCQFGPGLAELREMLNRYHPGATIVEQW